MSVGSYRVYTIDREGVVSKAEPIEAADDYDAIRQAQQLVDGQAVEIWNGKTLVIRLEPKRE